MTPQERHTFWKQKKRQCILTSNMVYNHPNHMTGISVGGTFNSVRDTRDFTTPPNPSTRAEVNVNLSIITPLIRLFLSNVPHFGNLPSIDDGKFYLSHQPLNPWTALFEPGAFTAPVIIGTEEITQFTKTGGIWNETGSSTEDVYGSLGVDISLGGHPYSGGRSPGDLENEKMRIDLTVQIDVFHAPGISRPNEPIMHFPWEIGSLDTSAYIALFDDYVVSLNATHGGGHSGTLALTAQFDG